MSKGKKTHTARSSLTAGAFSKESPSAPTMSDPGILRVWQGRVEGTESLRADKYIAETAKVMGRSQIKARGACLKVNGKAEKFSRKLSPGDMVELSWTEEPSHTLVPEKLDIKIIYGDDNVFVFDKAQGMVTHPGAGNWRGTLANAALWLDAERKGRGIPPRGGIVHRLDKDTSGVIIVARNIETHEFLSAQFKDRSTRKEYLAFVKGYPGAQTGRIENHLARDRRDRKKFASSVSKGKKAVTDYKVISQWKLKGHDEYSLLALYPRTGRTHQLRVHMAEAGCPIVGDPLYGKRDSNFPHCSLMLHARRLKIRLPGSVEASLFLAPVPERFRTMVAALRAGK